MIDYVFSHEQPPPKRANYTDFASKLPTPISLLQFSTDAVLAQALKSAPGHVAGLKSKADIVVKVVLLLLLLLLLLLMFWLRLRRLERE